MLNRRAQILENVRRSRKPKYGGPQGGRPQLGPRGPGAINYLVGARGHDSSIPQPESGSLTISPKAKRQIRRYKNRNLLTREQSNPNYEANGPLTHLPSMGAEVNKYKQRRRRRRGKREAGLEITNDNHGTRLV